MPLRVLVTGGAGFIGSALVRSLVAKQGAVCVVDDLSYAATLRNLDPVITNPRVRFERADIVDIGRMKDVVADFDPDCIINLAAETHVDRSIEAPAPFVKTNVVGTASLLEVSLDHWRNLDPARGQTFRFFQVSTDEVYGALGPGSPAVDERARYAPSSPYAASKAAADHLVRAWGRTFGLPVVLSVCSNNYGPGQFPDKLVPRTIRSIIDRAPIRLYGDGTQRRDWIFVDDHVDALMAIVDRGVTGETYNIGSGVELPNIELVGLMCDLIDSNSPPRDGVASRELITFVADRPGHDWRYALDTRKIHRDLGWHATRDLRSSLAATVDWYLDHPDWWAER